MQPFFCHRRGMTLVELLVVVTIILLLVVTVVPNVAGTQETRRAREAARTVSTFVAKAQSRAIGRAAWSGFMLVPINANGAVLDLQLAESPEPYRGDMTGATLTILGPVSGSNSGTNRSFVFVNGTRTTGTNDLIRFDGNGPFYRLALPLAVGGITGTVSFRLQDEAGQTSANTPWPAAGLPHTFEIFPQPRLAGSPVTLTGNRAIDLGWSGSGPVASYNTFSPGTAAAIVFDATGRLRQRIQGFNRIDLAVPVFLLVGRVDRAGQLFTSSLTPSDDSVANWQYPDSYWIGIDPMTGIVKTAECVPGASTVGASQAWIRQALLGSGG